MINFAQLTTNNLKIKYHEEENALFIISARNVTAACYWPKVYV